MIPEIDWDEEEFIRVKLEFHKFRDALFVRLPEDCLLKHPSRNYVDKEMLILSEELVRSTLVSCADICSLCRMDACPHNDVRFPLLRQIKIRILGWFFRKPAWMRKVRL